MLTLKLFLFVALADFLILAVSAALTCKDQTMYQENGCNYCFCSKGKLTTCTLKYCDGQSFYEKMKNCVIDTEWSQDCNACMCVEEYGTLCTIDKC